MTDHPVPRRWNLIFSVNGEEYHCNLIVTAQKVTRIDEKTMLADGVRLETEEYFIGKPEVLP